LEIQGQRSLGSKKIWNSSQLSMAETPHPESNSAVAKRLQALRYHLAGDSQTAFALRYNIEVKRWNNFERGFSLSKEIALHLCQRIPGLTLDWLYRGVEGGLPVQLQRELVEAGKAITEAASHAGARA
jgi:hypothetical protein